MPGPLVVGDSLADRSYRALRDAIATGELRPGEKVTERGLAERLSVSATPVREAIRRLELDGLLERTGPRTVKVSQIGDGALRDLAEVEVGLRGMVARFAARHATPEQLDRLDAVLDEADDLLILIKTRNRAGDDVTRHVHQLFDAMQRFNDTVDACARNPVLVRLLEQTRVFSRPEGRARRMERVAYDDEYGLVRYASHRALVQALRRGDAARAEALVIEDARGGLGDLLSGPHGWRWTDDAVAAAAAAATATTGPTPPRPAPRRTAPGRTPPDPTEPNPTEPDPTGPDPTGPGPAAPAPPASAPTSLAAPAPGAAAAAPRSRRPGPRSSALPPRRGR